MITRSRLAIIALVVVFGLASGQATLAAQSSCRPASQSSGLSLSVQPDPENATIARAQVEVAQPLEFYVEYGNRSVGLLRTPLQAASTSLRLPLLRLRSESDYQARAFAVGPDGCATAYTEASFRTGQLPDALRGAAIDGSGEPGFKLLLMDWPTLAPFLPPSAPGDRSRFLAGVDLAGQVIWYYQLPRDLPIPPPEASAYPIIRLRNGNLMYVAGYYGLEEITPDGRLVKRIRSEDPAAARAHHEVIEQQDGRLLFLGAEDRATADGTLLRGDTLHVVDPATQDLGHLLDPVSGAGRRIWSAFETIDPNDPANHPLVWSGWKIQGVPDWTHGNAMTNGDEGSVLISLRHLDQIVSVSLNSGKVEWKLGGPSSSFNFPDPDDVFHGQHAVQRLANGHILMFDNGNYRPSGEHSRALELALDRETMTARRVWEYRPDPPIYSDKISNVVRLPNGNTLVHFGWREAPDEPSVIQEVRPNGTIAWQQSTRWRGIRAARFRVYPIDTIGGEQEAEATAVAAQVRGQLDPRPKVAGRSWSAS